MRVIKNINNNFAVAVDGGGNQLIVSGKGIGFGSVPREVNDLSVINKSYYDIDETYVSMIQDIPEEIIDLSGKIVDKARIAIDGDISSNVVFALADHINFAIQRQKNNIHIKLPIDYDIQCLYETEMRIGMYGLKLIRNKFKISLPKEEAARIALIIINAENQHGNKNIIENEEVIDAVTKIIEKEFDIKVNKDTFSYSRFATHMHYLLKRGKTKHLLYSDNSTIYEKLKGDYPETYACVEIVCGYLCEKLKLILSDEEKLYLILHIIRLCTYEDCNQ